MPKILKPKDINFLLNKEKNFLSWVVGLRPLVKATPGPVGGVSF